MTTAFAPVVLIPRDPPAFAAETTVGVAAGPRVQVPLRTFKALRDENVVRQGYDYSCGAAALATLLTYGFHDPVSESAIIRQILDALPEDEETVREKEGLSLLDLQRVAQARGYRAQGFFVAPAALPAIDRPVIVFIEPRGYEHFAVLKGVADGDVFLADPSRGNIRVPLYDFLPIWVDDQDRGIIFAVEPPDGVAGPASQLAASAEALPRPELMGARQMMEIGAPRTGFPGSIAR